MSKNTKTQKPVLFTNDMDDDNVLTNFYAPDFMARSGYSGGKTMRHDEWIIKEVESFNRKGRKVMIVTNETDGLAIMQITEKKEKK